MSATAFVLKLRILGCEVKLRASECPPVSGSNLNTAPLGGSLTSGKVWSCGLAGSLQFSAAEQGSIPTLPAANSSPGAMARLPHRRSDSGTDATDGPRRQLFLKKSRHSAARAKGIRSTRNRAQRVAGSMLPHTSTAVVNSKTKNYASSVTIRAKRFFVLRTAAPVRPVSQFVTLTSAAFLQ